MKRLRTGPSHPRRPLGRAGTTRLQSAALVYRIAADGEKSVLVISKRRSRKWSIPKGNAEPFLSLADNAAKEAFEEAGVRGIVARRSSGMFRAHKRARRGSRPIEVWVYLLEATTELHDWPEKGEREKKWVLAVEAAQFLREPLLVELCRRLRQRASIKRS
jgi:8-oxo-dGTP pyrophosphatase MutT (NUDIX family)